MSKETLKQIGIIMYIMKTYRLHAQALLVLLQEPEALKTWKLTDQQAIDTVCDSINNGSGWND